MATITTRSGKGSPLTNQEVDDNFTNLNTDKAELSGAAFTGAITTTSTIDGRDVAADGAKLDGIESGATADQTAAEIRALVESATDSNVFTDADHTKLDGIEAGADVTDTTNVVAALTAGSNITIAADGTISSTDTNTQLTSEQVQDIVGAMLSGNTESGITVTYQDADGTIDFTVSSQTDENFTSALKTKLDGIEAGADVTDTANVVASLTAGSNVTIAADGTISSTDTNTQLSTEQVQDIVGAMFSGNTETRITATYQDTDGTIDLVVDNMNQSVGDATITISAGTSLSGGGDFTTNQSTNETITINHADTSSQASVNNSGNTVIQDVTLDTHGHVTGLTSKALSIPAAANNATITISAGTDLTGGGTFTTNQSTAGTITINHEDVSSQASVNNSGGTVIQDVTLNANGHVTALGSVNLDSRYFTESESDGRYARLTGATFTGNVTLSGADDENALTLSGTSPTMAFTDSGSEDDFYIHVNSNNFYVLTDRGGVGGYGAWETPHPLQLEADTNVGYLFGSRMFAENYHPNADKWTNARTLTLTGDATGSVSWDGSGNATMTTVVGDDSHFHHRLDSTDDRDVKPSDTGIVGGVQALKPFFTSFGGMTGASNATYLDMLAFDTYSDSSGGGPSAISFHKGASAGDPIMYIWKADWNATTWSTGQRVFADNYHPNADKLTTARTIAGSSFDGTANIDISYNNLTNKPSIPAAANNATITLSAGTGLSGGGDFTTNQSSAETLTFNLATPTDAPASWQDVVGWNGALIKDAAVEIHGSGYLRASYLNMTHGVGTRSSDTVFYSSTDDYIRKTNATGMRSSLNVPTRTGGDASGTWGISITGDAGTVDGLNASSFIRSDADDNVSGNTEWQDNYQVRFGNDADFRIFHDGNHAYFRNYNHAQGNIYFTGEDTAGTNKALIYMINNTARPYVQLFENGGERLKTTSTGVDLALGMSVAGTTVIDSSRNVTNLGTVGCGSLTSTGSINVGDGTAQSKVAIKKADNDASDHIEFYNGTTRIGEIGCQDTSWLRINQITNTNIYTPRYIRADNGFRVDGTALGIQGDGSSVIPVGSAATPSLRFNGDTNTGVYQNGADAVGISAGGTRRASFGTTIYLESDDVRINRYLYHNGDTNTYMRMDADRITFVAGAVEFIDMTEGSDDNINFNTRARFNKGIREQSDTLTGTAVTIDQNNATNFVHDLTGNTTYTFSNPAASGDSSSFTLKVIQDSTARTITWPTSVDWVGGSAPTLSSASGAVDVFVFFTHDGGTTYYGFVAGQDLK